MLGYIRIAGRLNIIDKPNQRSSHHQATIRGGGMIFSVGVLLWFFSSGFNYQWFTTGVVLIAVISFLDDIYGLSTRPRLAVHLISVGLLLIDLGLAEVAWYWWLLAIVLIIGWINAFNFMDGINGITAFYTLAVLLPLYWLNHQVAFVETSLIYCVGLATLVFSYFNARKRARCFAGDVGSVSMAFILAFFLTKLILITMQWYWILLVAVYGIDSVITIVQRLGRGENIFKAHRTHLYQYLANESGYHHVFVAGLYATIQLLVSVLVILLFELELSTLYGVILLALLSLGYLFVKRRLTVGLSVYSPRL